MRSIRTTFALLPLVLVALLVPATASADDPAQLRVVNGSPASTAQYPWQAAVVGDQAFYSGNGFQRQYCGGSLITSRIVLTAAHCVADGDPDCGPDGEVPICTALTDGPGDDGTERTDPDEVNAILGRTTLSDTPQGVEHGVVDVRVHPGYNRNTLEKDVAYLVLESASSQTPIDIAGPGEEPLWAPGSPTEVSGWGVTEFSSNGSDTLRAAVTPVISDASCASEEVYDSEFDPATMVCAGYLSGGVDTCQGDSGGPLQAPAQSAGGAAIYRLVGVTSWGDGCALPNAPGVYSRVAENELRAEILAQVFALEEDNGAAHEQVQGSGASPRSGGIDQLAPPPDTTAPTVLTARQRAIKKCKKVRNKIKRKRCMKRAKRLPIG